MAPSSRGISTTVPAPLLRLLLADLDVLGLDFVFAFCGLAAFFGDYVLCGLRLWWLVPYHTMFHL